MSQLASEALQRIEPVSMLWRVRIGAAIGLAVLYAFALSLQFLAQPFVWRNFPVNEVLDGWLFIFRDRLTVAIPIAMAVLAASFVRTISLRLRTVLIALGILSGAVIGEIIVRASHGGLDNVDSIFAHALRWSVVALAVAATFYLWRHSADTNDRLRHEMQRRVSIEQQLANTRLAALRSQIEPHFLFNTLATVRRLHHVEPVVGARILAGFIDYLRRVLPMLDRSEVPLGEEADLVRAYLSVIEVRMQGRLKIEIDVPAHLHQACIPPLVLATLVENAVKHGLTPSPTGGEIVVTAMEQEGQLELCVADTGVGLKLECDGGTGVGLSNVRARLATLYGVNASLRVEGNMPNGVRATIRLPCRLGGL